MYVFTTLCFLACILLKVFLRSLGIVYNHLEKARNIDPDSLGEEDYISLANHSWLIVCHFLFSVYVKLVRVILEYHIDLFVNPSVMVWMVWSVLKF